MTNITQKGQKASKGEKEVRADAGTGRASSQEPRSASERIRDHRPYAALYEHALPSTRSGPLFNAFSYPTKISPEAIALFIATHTEPGETVLDTFAGSGTTGIAARLCDSPTNAMRETAKTLGLDVRWGPRKAILYELSVVGSLLSDTMCHPPDPEEFSRAARSLIDSVRADLDWIYETTDPAGNVGKIRHIIWSEVLICNSCSAQITYWDAAVRWDPLELATQFTCTSCGITLKTAECERATTAERDDATGDIVHQRLRLPVRVHGTTGRKKWQRDVNEHDLALVEKIRQTPIAAWYPTDTVFWGDLHRSGYHFGIERYHHFYTRRNLLALSGLWDRIDQFPEALRDALRLLVLSFNATHSTLMTRVVLKKGQKDLVLTGAQSGVLYVSGLPVEKNVFEGVERKIRTFADAFDLTRESSSDVEVVNASSTKVHLADDSVTYVFTDPPFGAYIPYAELNQINEAWLSRKTDREEEAIISPAQGKGLDDYRGLLKQVFSEVARVLRPDGLATVVFHSSKAEVWKAVGQAFESSALDVVMASVLDKTQVSFKQAVSSTSSRGDALMLLAPNSAQLLIREQSNAESGRIVQMLIAQAVASSNPGELDAERLYSRYVGYCMAHQIGVDVGAAEFYSRIASDHSANASRKAVGSDLRKRLGQYFTGPRLASLLARLAEGRSASSVVDPMVGSGDMLMAVLAAGGSPSRLAGVEVEQSAFDICTERLKGSKRRGAQPELLHANAFDPQVGAQLGLCSWDLVITNPPYVRYQRASKSVTSQEAQLPSAEDVRSGLLATLEQFDGVNREYVQFLAGLAASYSGLADLAVPSWILCAALVAESGTLAMVVPDTWLTRDYSAPIQELLNRYFDVDYVVEDADAAWFDEALVRTTLVIARRRQKRLVGSGDGTLHVRLGRVLANDRSLVGELFPGAPDPDESFAAAVKSWHRARSSESLPGVELEWVERADPTSTDGSPDVAGGGQREGSALKPKGSQVHLPGRISRVLTKEPRTVTMQELGWRVGQGLRTGANSFFYVDLLDVVGGTAVVQPNKKLFESPVEVPFEALLPVVRKQDDLPDGWSLAAADIRGHVLSLHAYARRSDLDGLSEDEGLAKDLPFREMPPQLTNLVTHVEGVNLGTETEPRFVPLLSAVVTNARSYDARRPSRTPRFWYHLPTFAPRHTPDLLIPRVNYRHPRVVFNPDRAAIVDANFSTLWAEGDSALHPFALLAVLVSTWSKAVMESSGTVLGAGALKLEATQLKKLPVPADVRSLEVELTSLGSELMDAEKGSAAHARIDALIWKALGLGSDNSAQAQLSALAMKMLEARSR